MRFIGDIHGKWLEYLNVIHDPKNPCSESVQIGDFGLGFQQRQEHVDYVFGEMNKENHNHRFIRGNHDSPAECKANQNWIPDGLTENGMMFVGGAHSIDQAHRVPGVSWWEDEELSYQELGEMIAKYEEYKPDVMVTHDAPDVIARHLFPYYRKNDPMCNSRTRNAFETMFTIHKPKLWIFGHWHESINTNILGTDFVCLAELEFMDVEL